MKKPALTAIGITCGVGSMLVGARQAGFKVLGNVEWRKYYHQKDEQGKNTFTENFGGVPFPFERKKMTEEEFRLFSNPDIALGHPECGNFSQMNNTNNFREDRMDPADIPLFVDLVADFQPRFFVMDDLPPSLLAFTMREYHERLPDYDLFPEWVSNYHYGNVQKNRRRFFMLGAKREEGWTFRPGESENSLTVADVIGDLPDPSPRGNYPNHEPHVLDNLAGKGQHLTGRGKHSTWREVSEWFRDKRAGKVIEYVSASGDVKTRPGTYKGHWHGHGHVMDGGSAAIHHHRGLPYTIRERALLQGFPDDFVFYGTKLEDDGSWNHDKNIHMVKQTGKAMPVQFCRYVSRQIHAHILGEPFECTDYRVIPPSTYVNDAKRWYCANVGYGVNQAKACDACWMTATCEIRTARLGLKTRGPIDMARTLPTPALDPSNRRTWPLDKPPLTAEEAAIALMTPPWNAGPRFDKKFDMPRKRQRSSSPGPLAQVREAGPPVDPTRPGRGVTAIAPGVPVRSQRAPGGGTLIRTGTKTSSGRTYIHVKCGGCGLETRSFISMRKHREAVPACQDALEIKL